MKITKKELSYLLYLFGILFAFGGVMYSNTLATETETLTSENVKLESEVAYLQDLNNHKQEYLDEMDRMNMEMEDMKAQFPARILPEDQIMYANNLEAKFDVLLESVDMPGVENISVAVETAAPAAPTTDAATTEVDPMAEADQAATTPVAQETATESVSSMVLSKASTSFTYQANYSGLKDFIKYINEDTDRKSIESLSVGYDSTTGNLSGNFTINMYALSGTGKEYEAPVVTGVPSGKAAIFTGVDRLNRSTQGSSDVAVLTEDADAATEDSEETQENE